MIGNTFKKSLSFLGFLFLLFFFASVAFAGNPVAPIEPDDNIQDPGDPGTAWGGCGPADSNCYVTVVSQWTTTGSDIYYTTGNVGIGDSTPSAKLDVTLASTATSGNLLGQQINFSHSGVGSGGMQATVLDVNASGFGTNLSDLIGVDISVGGSGGTVNEVRGIKSMVDVNDYTLATDVYGGQFGASNGTNNYGIHTSADGGTNNYGVYASAAGGTINYAIYSAVGKNFFSGETNIGSTTDLGTYNLQVTGNSIFTTSSTVASNKGIEVLQTGATSGTDYAGYFSNTGAATTNVGLYATATGGTNNYAGIFEAGNVGIGTASPTVALDVAGSAKVTTNLTVNPSGIAVPAAFLTYQVTAANSGTTTGVSLVNANNTADTKPIIIGQRARGTLSAMLDVALGDDLFGIIAGGIVTATRQTPAEIVFVVDGAPTTGNIPTKISFKTGTNGGNRTQRMFIGSSGDVVIGNTTESGYRFDVLKSTAGQTASTRVANFSNAGATFDTTAGALSSYGGYFSSTSTESAGGNVITNIGLYSTASGADANYAGIFDAGTVGIGITTPDLESKLDLVNSSTTATPVVGEKITITHPFESAINDTYTFGSTVSASSTNSIGGGRTVGQQISASGNYLADSFGYTRGIEVTASGAGETAAGYFINYNSTGTNAYGIYTGASISALTNMYGVYIAVPGTEGGTLTNNYGLYIEDQSTIGSSKAMNLYSVGANSSNYFEGEVGIGNTAPAVALHVGDATVTDATTLLRLEDANSTCNFTADAGAPTCGSDQSLKKDISPLDTEDLLERIAALNPVSYRWKTDGDNADLQYGFIAQEVEEQFPNLVTENTWIDGSTKKFLSTNGLIPYAIGAIKELDLKIKDIENFAEEDNSFGNRLRAWFADAGNQISDIFSDHIHVRNTLCIGETCINEAQLKALLQNAGMLDQNNSDEPEPSDPTPDPTPEPEPTLPTPEGVGTPTDNVGADPIPTPEITPEPESNSEPEETASESTL